jgi:hypothetical protein
MRSVRTRSVRLRGGVSGLRLRQQEMADLGAQKHPRSRDSGSPLRKSQKRVDYVSRHLLAVKSGSQYPTALVASVNHRGVVPGAQPFGVPEGDPIIGCLPKLPISELDPIPNLSIAHVRRVSRGEDLYKGNPVADAPPFIDGIPAPNIGRSQPPDWRGEVRALGKLPNAFAADAEPPGNLAPCDEILWFLPLTSHLSSHRRP